MNAAWSQILDLDIPVKMLLMSPTFPFPADTGKEFALEGFVLQTVFIYLLQASNICTLKKNFLATK